MRVFLIHGMGRSRASMLSLASKLKRAGHQVSLFGYSVARDDLDVIAKRFVTHIDSVRAGDDAPYAIIGHSLGNIITRFATPDLPPGLTRFVMLAPPNQSPKLARLLRDNFIFRTMTKDAGRRLSDPDFYAKLPRPDVPTVILAGSAGPSFAWLPFEGQSDGVVEVDETRIDGVPHRIIPALHTFIMNHALATKTISHFLSTGELGSAA